MSQVCLSASYRATQIRKKLSSFMSNEGQTRRVLYLTSGAVFGSRLEKRTNKELRIPADLFPIALVEDNASLAALIDEIREALAAEGRVSTEEGISDDSQRPHINSLSMALLEHNLRRSVSKRSSHGV